MDTKMFNSGTENSDELKISMYIAIDKTSPYNNILTGVV